MDLTSQSVRVNLATRHATLYGLDPLIVCAVIDQESDWDTWAIRYEPAFFSRYIQPIQSGPRPLSATEAAARAFSFGLMQIMGQTARELGFASLFLVELCDPDTGVDFGLFRSRGGAASLQRRGEFQLREASFGACRKVRAGELTINGSRTQ